MNVMMVSGIERLAGKYPNHRRVANITANVCRCREPLALSWMNVLSSRVNAKQALSSSTLARSGKRGYAVRLTVVMMKSDLPVRPSNAVQKNEGFSELVR